MAYQGDQQYFTDRVRDEIERGDEARSSSIAAIHYELAYRYSLLCASKTGRLTLVGDSDQPIQPSVFTHCPSEAQQQWRMPRSEAASLAR